MRNCCKKECLIAYKCTCSFVFVFFCGLYLPEIKWHYWFTGITRRRRHLCVIIASTVHRLYHTWFAIICKNDLSYICSDVAANYFFCLLDVVDYRNCRINVTKKVLKHDSARYFDRYKVDFFLHSNAVYFNAKWDKGDFFWPDPLTIRPDPNPTRPAFWSERVTRMSRPDPTNEKINPSIREV